MSQVSKDALEPWWRWLALEQLPPDLLIEGTGLVLADLRGAERIPWDDYIMLLERFAALVGGERALFEWMRAQTSLRADPFAPLFRNAVEPRTLYRVVTTWMGPQLFTVTEAHLEELSEHELRMQLRIPPPHRSSPFWFWGARGTLSRLPTGIGWPLASIDMTLGEREASYRITVRPPTGVFPRLRRWLPAQRVRDELTTAMAVQQEELQRSYQALAEATRDIELRAERARRMARTGARLAEQVELPALLEAIGEIGIQQLGLSGLEVTVPVAGEVFRSRAGQTTGTARIHELARSRPLGTLVAWHGEDPESHALVEALLPWLALAVDNALHFEEQRRANTALGASEARWRVLVENIPDVVLTLDPQFRVTHVNRVDFGFTLDDLLGIDVFAHIPDPNDLREQVEQVFVDGQVRGAEGAWTGKDGVKRWIAWRIGGIVQDECVRSAVLMLRDETARRNAERERRTIERRMLQAQKLDSLGVLAGGIAHDFNNLLMGITANAELASLHLPEDHQARRFVERIETAGARAGELTRQMLTYAGRRSVRPEPIDLTHLVEELSELMRSAVPRQVTLQLELSSDLPWIEGDPAQLQQVLINMLTNAADAVTGAGGTVTVRTSRSRPTPEDLHHNVLTDPPPTGGCVAVDVIDDGCGMDAETRRRIFDPFFSTKEPGRGLGLSAVLGIVRAHHGALLVQSEPGVGSTFRVLFPASETAVPKPAPEPPPTDRPLAGRRLLVVEDESLVRQAACDLLGHHGAVVLAARDGVEGVQVFEKHEDIDLVLLDLTMPGMHGEQVFEAMQARRPGVPIVLTSGYDARDAVRVLERRGLAGFIRKPFESRRLVETIVQALSVA